MEQLHEDKPNPLVALVAVFQDGARLRFGTNPPVQQEHVMIGLGQLLARWGVQFDVMPEVDARRDAKASDYVLQRAEGSTCPTCLGTLLLLCPWDVVNRPRQSSRPSFYLCPQCQRAAEIGVGPVSQEGDR